MNKGIRETEPLEQINQTFGLRLFIYIGRIKSLSYYLTVIFLYETEHRRITILTLNSFFWLLYGVWIRRCDIINKASLIIEFAVGDFVVIKKLAYLNTQKLGNLVINELNKYFL